MDSDLWYAGKLAWGKTWAACVTGSVGVRFAVAALALSACASEEPALPSGRVPEDGRLLRVPVGADGTLDTAGMAVIRFGESRHDFGAVDEGAVVTHRFAFRNAGATPLLISNATSTCGCTIPSWPREPVGPGDTASVLVRFDTDGKAGPQVKTVTLLANTYPNRTQVSLVGTVDALN